MSKLKIADVAKALGWSIGYVRIKAQRGELPFVFASKTNGRYRYTVYPEKYREYIGG
jgi:hypothetical protein